MSVPKINWSEINRVELDRTRLDIHPIDPYKLEESLDENGNTLYKLSTQMMAYFNNQQEEFILKAIHKIGDAYGIVYSFNSEKIADALNKSIQKKVKNVDRGPIDDSGDRWYTPQCPHCDTIFRTYEVKQKPDYCCECGQHLDWSDIH